MNDILTKDFYLKNKGSVDNMLYQLDKTYDLVIPYSTKHFLIKDNGNKNNDQGMIIDQNDNQ